LNLGLDIIAALQISKAPYPVSIEFKRPNLEAKRDLSACGGDYKTDFSPHSLMPVVCYTSH
jgi:hypothetical protein